MVKSSGRISDVRFFQQKLTGIDVEPIEFECDLFTGFTSLQILQEIQNNLQKRNIKPEECTDRIIFMSMSNDIDWTGKRHDGI